MIADTAARGLFDKQLGQATAARGLLDKQLMRAIAPNLRLGEQIAQMSLRGLDGQLGQFTAARGLLDKQLGQATAARGLLDKQLGQATAARGLFDKQLGQATAARGLFDKQLMRAIAPNLRLGEQIAQMSLRGLDGQLGQFTAARGLLDKQLGQALRYERLSEPILHAMLDLGAPSDSTAKVTDLELKLAWYDAWNRVSPEWRLVLSVWAIASAILHGSNVVSAPGGDFDLHQLVSDQYSVIGLLLGLVAIVITTQKRQ